VLIVARNKLGVINHTLLTVEALKVRNIKILGIIFNNISDGTDRIILRDNPGILKKISGEKILGIMPESKTVRMMRKKFIPIGDNIFKQWI
jgi:dethiobiotin synthetase